MNTITTIPASYFAQWKPVPNDPRVARYLGMHDGTTLRHFTKHNGFDQERIEYDAKPWFWMVTVPRPPKQKLDGGDSVCFMVHQGRIIGYFDIVAVGLKKDYAWVPDEIMVATTADDKMGLKSTVSAVGYSRLNEHCLVLANWHPGDYGTMAGFQGWRYTQIQP